VTFAKKEGRVIKFWKVGPQVVKTHKNKGKRGPDKSEGGTGTWTKGGGAEENTTRLDGRVEVVGGEEEELLHPKCLVCLAPDTSSYNDASGMHRVIHN